MPNLTVHPPFGSNTSTNKDGQVLVSALLTVLVPLFALPFTIVRRGKVLGLSDAATTLAFILGAAEAVVLFVGRNDGLGVSSTLPVGDQHRKATYVLSSEELYLAAIGIHKCWVVLIAWRLAETSHMPSFRKGCLVGFIVASAWTLASIVSVAAHCAPVDLSGTQSDGTRCPALYTKWLAICIVDILTDVFNLGLVIWLIWPLQMIRSDKIAVISSFFVKFGCIPFSIARAITFHQYVSAHDKGIAIVDVLVWQNAQITWAGMSAAAPSLLWMRKSFDVTISDEDGRALPSMFGQGGSSSNHDSGNTNKRKGQRSKSSSRPSMHSRYTSSHKSSDGESFPMRRIIGKPKHSRHSEVDDIMPVRLENADYTADVQTVARSRQRSMDSSDSDAKLIHVDVVRSVRVD